MSERPNIFPALRYQDAPAAIEWLVTAFGFEKQAVFANPDGTIAHAQLQLGDAVVGLNSTIDAPGNPWSTVKQGIYICVKDADAHHARAVAAGAVIASPLVDQSYGSRDYSARDVDGNLWGFGTYDMDAPIGRPALFPELRYKDGAAASAFLRDAFGFQTTLDVPGPNGTIYHAEMVYEGGIIFIGSAPGDEDAWCGLTHCTNVYVPDPDAHCARAQKHGATIVGAPRDTPWGARGYSARDLEGFLWGFSTYRPKSEV